MVKMEILCYINFTTKQQQQQIGRDGSTFKEDRKENGRRGNSKK